MEEKSALRYQIENGIGTIIFDEPQAKVNVLSAVVLRQLDKILDQIAQNKDVKALLIRSPKKDIFIAGADIKEIEGIKESGEGEEKSQAGQAVFNKLEDLYIPTVAVINGACLGGGCELALACRYRVATFSEKVSIGLPEVKLGILPGFGGTYRLPRVIGLSEALNIILGGKTLSSPQALKVGLVDRLFPESALDTYLPEFLNEIIAKKKKKRKKKLQEQFLNETFLGRAIVFRTAYKSVMAGTKGFYPAPPKSLEVLKRAHGASRSKALALESKAFGELVVTEVSKNLVKLFYLTEKYKKLNVPGAENITPQAVNKCAVIGAGIMGGGIAQLLSDKGIWVRLKDINYDAIAKGFKAAYKVYADQVKRRRLKLSEASVKMARITSSVDFSGFKNVDMVIEAVVENMDIKKKVFKELSSIVSDNTILCTNTSALSVAEMARETKDPSRVIGFHFFNPVHRMPLVEIIKAPSTSPQTIATALNFAKRLGKIPILVKDSSGFLVNRILLGYINEAGKILEEGERIEAIDRIMTDFGMPMGPLALSDEVGLDVGLKVLHVLEAGLGERFKAANVYEKVCEKGLLGKKSKKGFYTYGKERRANEQIYKLLAGTRPPKKIAGKDDQLKRMLYIMINEAARCLEDGVVEEAATVDVGMIMGTGFPPFRGGLLRFADSIGIDKICEDLERLSAHLQSERFKPCAYLNNLKREKKQFYSS